ncbi:MAG: uroporphyrinogen-III synthase [Halobacteria archaeon]|nr:uroporphyrinogen-III synthase [Halobacteria archaeon]
MTTVAIFRPSDDREKESRELLQEMGFDVVSDPLLEPRRACSTPITDADYVVFTSVTGVKFGVSEENIKGLRETQVCAIGPKTRDALESRGVSVSLIPEDYTSEGLVEALSGSVYAKKVEVARSDHGSPELIEGLNDAGAFVHETVLYHLMKPEEGGQKTVEGLINGDIDAVLFTSSLTVEHLVDAAGGNREELVEALSRIRVGAIGEPTRRTAEGLGIEVDFVPESETFEDLAQGLNEYFG